MAGLTKATKKRVTGQKVPAPKLPVGKPKIPAATAGALNPAPYSFMPYQAPTSPPTGTYDPNLDASLAAAKRGYSDLEADTAKVGGRAFSDYNIALGDKSLGEQSTGLEGQRARGLADSLRQYTILGNRQTQAARGAGVSEGGALAAALAKRQANQTRDDTRLNTSIDQAEGDLGLRYQRGVEDRGDVLGRAGRELGFYGQDIGASKFFQAGQAGFELPTRPADQGVGPTGTPYKKLTINGRKVFADAAGALYDQPPGTAGAKVVGAPPKKPRVEAGGLKLTKERKKR